MLLLLAIPAGQLEGICAKKTLRYALIITEEKKWIHALDRIKIMFNDGTQ